MRRRKVVLRPSAKSDIKDIQRWIEANASKRTTDAYVARLNVAIRRLGDQAEIGLSLPELGSGFRMTNFAGAYSIVFRVELSRVVVFRVVHGVRDLATVLAQTNFGADGA